MRTLTGSSVSPPRLMFAGGDTPAAGAYTVRSRLATAVVGFLSYADSTNGGYGSVQFQVSFDSGAHWLTLYQTGVVDRLGGIVAIAEPGRDYEFRLTLTNDADRAVVLRSTSCYFALIRVFGRDGDAGTGTRGRGDTEGTRGHGDAGTRRHGDTGLLAPR